jgi:hypothetical protein
MKKKEQMRQLIGGSGKITKWRLLEMIWRKMQEWVRKRRKK